MDRVLVNLGKRSYDIVIGAGIIDKIGENIAKKYKKILIITNDVVGPLYAEKAKAGLSAVSPEIHIFTVADGEDNKKIETVLPIYDYMVENNFDRSSLVVSLGGGVICDMTGYVAATFMRGIDFIQIPTTLLAQVDASVGGKVAVNHKNAKNLIGAFYQPKMVYIDIETLLSLNDRELRTGLAEAVKHGIILDAEYFDFIDKSADLIMKRDKETLIKLVKRSCELKAYVVSEDEEERGLRAILNYGHTFGHVVESVTKYNVYRHGEAVTQGMAVAAFIAKELGMVDNEFIETQNRIFDKLGMKRTVVKYNFEKVLEILKHDKKVKDGKLIFILPEKIGKAQIVSVDESTVEKAYGDIDGVSAKGVIDIGTNTTRLFVGEEKNGQIFNKYLKLMEITRLGEEVDKNRYLKEEAIARTVKTLVEYSAAAREYGVEKITAVATSASRDASNGADFIKLAKEDAGIDIKIIDGEKEGTLAFTGVMTDSGDGDVLVIDIGGGSTEFIYGNKEGIKFIKSLDIGSVRLKEKYFKNEEYDNNLKPAKEWLYEKLDEIKELKGKEYRFVGVAGTVTTQVSVTKKMETYDSREVHGFILSNKMIESNLKLFKSVNVEKRKEITGLHPKRADVIVSGTILLGTIMEYLNLDEITVSESDILEGIMAGL